jgi:ribosomal protein S18 acetylase RimI-like enzyme
MVVVIRPANEGDEAGLSRVCLLTANAGKSAEDLHEFGELPGLVFSVPYVKLPTTWAFVLVDEDKHGEVVGYIVGSVDTRGFEKYAEEHYWPALASKYPPSRASRPDDERYMKRFAEPERASDSNIQFSPAHLHINILPEYQRQGWGRKMVGTALSHLAECNVDGVWLGIDPRNKDAEVFYKRIGFKQIGETWFGISQNEFV